MSTKLDTSTPVQRTLAEKMRATTAAVPFALGVVFHAPGAVPVGSMTTTPHVVGIVEADARPKDVGGTAMNGNMAVPNLPSGFEYRDEHTVSRFLQDNPFLANILRDAPARIAESFGEDSSVILAVFSDPSEDASDKLTLRIRAHMSVDEAFERLDRLYDEWWLGVLPDMQHKMSIALVPV